MLHELYDDETGLDEINLDEPAELKDPLDVRRTMIRLEQLGRDLERVKTTRAAVAASYDAQLDRIERDRQHLRRSLDAYVRVHGPARFPDVGTAYLRKTDAKIEIDDRQAFRRALGQMFVRQEFDETAAKAYALEQATTTGELVAGARLVPADQTLAVRKA